MNHTMKKSLLVLALSATMSTGAAYAAPNDAPQPTHAPTAAAAQSVANLLFVEQILQASFAAEGSSVSITQAEKRQSLLVSGIITAVFNEEGRTAVQIRGVNTEGIVLNVGKGTVLETADGAKLSLSDLHIGLTVTAEHSLVMTSSLPPQTPTYKITAQDWKKMSNLLGTAGEIREVQKGDDGRTSIVIQGSGLSKQAPNKVVLQINDNTVLVDKDGKPVDRSALVQGASAIGFYAPKLTKSLPPVGSAWKVMIDKPTREQESMSVTGVITAVNNKEGQSSVQIQGIGTEGIVLNIRPDTVLEKADGTKLSLADLHIGMTVKAEHSPIMTFSLPPQTPTYKITVLDKKVQADLLGTAGKIEEVRKDANGQTSIVIKGTGLTEQSPDEVVLRIGDDTILINKTGEPIAQRSLVKGAKAIGFYGPMLTHSLPPIGHAWKVVVDTNE